MIQHMNTVNTVLVQHVEHDRDTVRGKRMKQQR